MKMKKTVGIVIGLLLIACGVICILGISGIADVNLSLDGWWTLFIIIPCINGLLTGKDKVGSLVGIFIGVALLLAARDVFPYDRVWEFILPVIIIALGIKLIIKTFASPNEEAHNEGEQKEHLTAFNSQTVDYSDEEITVAKIGAVFGGTRCSLTNAEIKDGARLKLLCAFGGADIIVPQNVNVKINAFCLFGGISDKRVITGKSEDNVTLNIDGFCIFGGADIK